MNISACIFCVSITLLKLLLLCFRLSSLFLCYFNLVNQFCFRCLRDRQTVTLTSSYQIFMLPLLIVLFPGHCHNKNFNCVKVDIIKYGTMLMQTLLLLYDTQILAWQTAAQHLHTKLILIH